MESPRRCLSMLLAGAALFMAALRTEAQTCPGSWQRVATSGPSPRYATAMAYDFAQGGTVLFGGNGSGSQSRKGDTWLWDGATWTLLASGGPSPRMSHAMAYDSGRSRIVLFGGFNATVFLNDVWEWNGSAWLNATPTGPRPSPRVDAALAYDSARGRTVLFGGMNMSNQPLADTWEWNGVAWSQVVTTGPAARYRAGLAFDPLRNVTVLFGGGNGTASFGDTWEWNGTAWAQRQVAGPSARSASSLAANGLCTNAFLYGGEAGGFQDDSWGFDGTVWTRLAVSGPGPRNLQAMAYDGDRNRAVVFGGIANGPQGDTWEWVSPCAGDEAATVDANGNVVFPPDLDTGTPPSYADLDQNLGDIRNLYPAAASDLDTWYPQMTCNPSIGGTVPPAASNPNIAGQLAAAGINATPQAVVTTLAALESQIAQQAAQEPDPLAAAGTITHGLPSQPRVPHCAETGCGYAFGGRDIVFVHGLRLDPLFDKIFGTDLGARTTWPQDKSAFYGQGYWKRGAERYWADHIKKFFTDHGLENRYVVVAYSSTQRLAIGVQAILTQIADAMESGIGVVDPTGRNDVSKFGTPSFVVVSHSTGGLITDVAMSAAARVPGLHASFIPIACKAHIAMNAVFSGSRLATAAVALSSYIALNQPPAWLCPLAGLGVKALNELGSNNPTISCPLDYLVVADSILIDLVPLVAQQKWGPYVASTPVRTLTVAGGHPSYLAPLKNVLHLGFDDGVSNVESQVGNPNSALFWPDGYQPSPGGLARVFDMGVWKTEPARAIDYYIDQMGDRLLNPLSPQHLVAAGPTPFLSPTGMLQPVGTTFGTPFNPLDRYPNHFSFLWSAADHYLGSTGPFTHGNDYRPTFSERNPEETRVLTDPAVYQPYPMLYAGDDGPLLTHAQTPAVEEIVKGRNVTFKIFRHKYGKTRWIWKRRYHLLAGWDTSTQMDYIYGRVLTQGIPACPPPSAANDCNGNGIADVCDVANGASRDCNLNGVPDECEANLPPKIVLQPVAQGLVLGQTATFLVTVSGAGPFRYEWRKDGVNLINGGAISGADTNLLKISPMALGDGGVYDVAVSSGCGQTSSVPVDLFCVLDPGLLVAGNTSAVHAVLAQTFRPSQTGILTRIVHGLRDGGSGSVHSYNLYVTGTTGGQPLWPGGVIYSAMGLSTFASGGLVDGVVPVANGPSLSTAMTYALVLEPVGAGDLFWRGNSGAGSYPNGAAFQKVGNGPWVPNALGPKDFGFMLEGGCL